MKAVISSNTCRDTYFSKTLIQDLQANGIEVVAFANADESLEKLQALCRVITANYNPRGTSPRRDLSLLKQYVNLYKTEKPDVVLNYNAKPVIYGGIAAKKLSIPSISNMTGLGKVYLKPSLLQSIMSFLYRRALRADGAFTFFVNPDDQAVFLKKRIVTEKTSAILPGRGVNLEYYKTAGKPKQTNCTRFVFAGRLLISKGLDDYLQAAKLLKEKYGSKVSFAICGNFENAKAADPDFIDKAMLERFISDGIVKFEGFVTDMKTYIDEACDCLVLPSYYREGVPRVLLQAISLSKAIIGCDSAGTREPVFDGQNGYLCQKQNPKDLAEKMERYLLLTDDERNAMSKKAREIAEKYFDEKIISQRYLELIQKLKRL